MKQELARVQSQQLLPAKQWDQERLSLSSEIESLNREAAALRQERDALSGRIKSSSRSSEYRRTAEAQIARLSRELTEARGKEEAATRRERLLEKQLQAQEWNATAAGSGRTHDQDWLPCKPN